MKRELPTVIGALVAGWVTWLWVWPLGLLAAIPLTAVAALQGKKPAVLVTTLSPFIAVPVAAFLAGVATFAAGSAQLYVFGLPTVEANNLHPAYRVPQVPVAEANSSAAVFSRWPYNAAVHSLGKLFGQMPGSYRGAYPAKQAAWAKLDGEGRYVWLDSQKVSLGAGTLQLAPALMKTLNSHKGRLRGLMMGKTTLVIGNPQQLWLVDIATGEPFATFVRGRLATGWVRE